MYMFIYIYVHSPQRQIIAGKIIQTWLRSNCTIRKVALNHSWEIIYPFGKSLCEMIAKQSLMNCFLLSCTNIDISLCVKTALWEDQFTDKFSLVIEQGAFLFVYNPRLRYGKTRTNRELLRHACTRKAVFWKSQQTQKVGLNCAFRKINM